MELLAVNLSAVPRRAALHGREYLVAPLTLIVPGVLNGNQGPLYYPEDQLRPSTPLWNNVPILLRHPPNGSDGRQQSAQDPGVLEDQGCGFLRNATYSNKLVTEGWIDVARLRELDAATLNRVERGEKVELSTGLIAPHDGKAGTYNGHSYVGTTGNYRPDHLALLPDGVGACSVADGCGVNVNEKGQPMDDRQKQGIWDKLKEMVGLVDNTKSTADPPLTPSNTPSKKEDNAMDEKQKKTAVQYILANCSGCDGLDEAALNELTDIQLAAWHEQVKQAQASVQNARKPFKVGEVEYTYNEKSKTWAPKQEPKKPEGKTVENKDAKPVLTPEQEADLAFARQVRQERRDESIAKIKTNEANKLTDEQLAALPMDVLMNLAASQPVKAEPIYVAGGDGASQQTVNRAKLGMTHYGLPGEQPATAK